MMPGMAATAPACVPTDRWVLRRLLFLLAGSFTLLGTALAAFVSPWFLLMLAVGWCPVSLLLGRLGVPD